MQDSPTFAKHEIRRDNWRIALLWGCTCVLLVAAVFGAVWVKIKMDQAQLIRQAEIETAARTESYAEQILRSVAQIDQLSMSIKYQWERKPGALDLEDQFRRGV